MIVCDNLFNLYMASVEVKQIIYMASVEVKQIITQIIRLNKLNKLSSIEVKLYMASVEVKQIITTIITSKKCEILYKNKQDISNTE